MEGSKVDFFIRISIGEEEVNKSKDNKVAVNTQVIGDLKEDIESIRVVDLGINDDTGPTLDNNYYLAN